MLIWTLLTCELDVWISADSGSRISRKWINKPLNCENFLLFSVWIFLRFGQLLGDNKIYECHLWFWEWLLAFYRLNDYSIHVKRKNNCENSLFELGVWQKITLSTMSCLHIPKLYKVLWKKGKNNIDTLRRLKVSYCEHCK